MEESENARLKGIRNENAKEAKRLFKLERKVHEALNKARASLAWRGAAVCRIASLVVSGRN